ncbi:hypothetical protein [Thiohalobacter thiocyanaticus]|uniref:Uncharacterized protein n=1 Tax=Thiohalobacter thiocyanaticus TaxID=585455 RepID=A0A426QJ98_9GAMM|nr:hypothetical protein [Thiohalobacter thiocyanaticus]RRQ21841.1 hypothetical protein D6C00_07705 [Thiohalobacter thiocyanaticus]
MSLVGQRLGYRRLFLLQNTGDSQHQYGEDFQSAEADGGPHQEPTWPVSLMSPYAGPTLAQAGAEMVDKAATAEKAE